MRNLNRMMLCVASLMAALIPSTSWARDNVYFNFGYSSGYPGGHHYSSPYPTVVHAVPVYRPRVGHYHHYYSPRPVYVDRCGPRGYMSHYRPHHGRRDHNRHHWRNGGDRYDRSHYDRRGGSRVFVELND